MILTVEKCFALYFPLKGKIVCTLKNAKKISAGTALVFLAFDAQFLFLYDAKTTSNGQKLCDGVRVSKDYWAYFDKIDSFLYSFIPLSVMLIANCLIILKFVLAKWKNRHGDTGSVNQAMSKSAVRGTVMLLTVSIAFIVLTSPVCIAISVPGLPKTFRTVAGILQNLNHSINGVLYCITGSRFRQELKNLFSCNRTKRNMTSSGVGTVTSQVRSTTFPISLNLNEV